MNTNKTFNADEFVSNPFGDVYLPAVNGNLFEDIAYSTYYNGEILEKLSRIHTYHIIIGTDCGLLLKQLQLNKPAHMSTYLLLESQDVLDVLSDKQIAIKQENIFLRNIEQCLGELKQSDYSYYFTVNRIQITKSFSAQSENNQAYLFLEEKIKEEINNLKWKNFDKHQRLTFIQNQLQNSIDNFNPATKLKNLLQRKSALILSGGPSLDNYIDWIEKNQQYFVVIAVSRVAVRLLGTKIKPDIFITADPFKTAYPTSKEIFHFIGDSILISQSYAHPKIISQWQGKHYYLGDLFPYDSHYKVENITAIGPTVSNCAIHVALQLGIFEQILFGVDLCYNAAGHSHVSSTPEHNKGVKLGFVGMPIKTNNNNIAETTYDMFHAVSTISLLAELAMKSGGRIVNPNPDAAYVEYVSHQPLEKIKIPEKSVSAYSILTTHVPELSNQECISHASKVVSELTSLLDIGKEIKSLLLRLIVLSPSYAKGQDACAKFKEDNIDEAIVIETKLADYSNVMEMIAYFGKVFFVFYQPLKINERINLPEFNRSAYQHYFHLSKACDLFTEFIENIIVNNKVIVQDDLKEIKNHQSIAMVTNKDKLLPQGASVVKNKSKIKEDKVVLMGVENKLASLFKQNDVEKLLAMLNKLKQYNSVDSIALKHLAKGYLLELEGKTEQSLDEYLDADTPQTRETALKQVVNIALAAENIELVDVCLQILADISIDYLPQLAHLYQVAGQHRDALDTYLKYLESKPDDIIVLIKLGLLYLSLEIKDGAEFVFKSVLDIRPDEQTALYYLQQCQSH